MKSATFAFASLLASAAVAQPHRHQQFHHKRQGVDWVTVWDIVTDIVDVTETVWVTPGFVPPTTSTKVVVSTTSTSSTSSEVPAQFFQGPQAESTSSTSPVYVAPTPSSTYVPPPPVPTPSSSSSTPVYVAPTQPPAPVYVPPTTAPEAPAPAATTAPADPSSSSSGGASSGCTAGSPCSGDITYYQAGLGACGWTNDGDTENIVALPHGLMGTQSNGNPYCGQMITIKCTATGKTTTAKVADKCMGCEGNSIDLSNAAFLDLDDLSVGRTGAEWWFN